MSRRKSKKKVETLSKSDPAPSVDDIVEMGPTERDVLAWPDRKKPQENPQESSLVANVIPRSQIQMKKTTVSTRDDLQKKLGRKWW